MGAYPCQFYAAKGLKSGLNGRLRARNWAFGDLFARLSRRVKGTPLPENNARLHAGRRLGHVPAIEKVRANEGVEIAIEDLLDVAALDLGAVVFDQLVGLHGV
jgi:hypothetical protein